MPATRSWLLLLHSHDEGGVRPPRSIAPAGRPDRERGRRRRAWLLAHASESQVRLQVVADQAGGKHTGDSRNRDKGGQPAWRITTPDRRGRGDAYLWRLGGPGSSGYGDLPSCFGVHVGRPHRASEEDRRSALVAVLVLLKRRSRDRVESGDVYRVNAFSSGILGDPFAVGVLPCIDRFTYLRAHLRLVESAPSTSLRSSPSLHGRQLWARRIPDGTAVLAVA